MANQRSDLMTNILATPKVANSVRRSAGRNRIRVASFTGDLAQDDILVLARFKATDTILSAKLYMTAFGVAATGDLGIYVAGDWTLADQALAAGGAEDRIASAVVMNGAIATGTELWNESGTITANIGDPLWEQAGASSEPAAGTQYDIGLNIEAANPPAGATVVVVFEYLAGD